MSYILDALRRADAERERGGVPGLHAQPQRGEPDDDTRRPGLPWAGIAIALGLALVVVLAWLLLYTGPAAEPPAPVAAAPVAPVVPAAPPAPAPAAAVAPAPAPAPAPPPAPLATTPPPPAPVTPPAAAAPPPRPVARPAAAAPSPSPSPARTQPAPAPAPARKVAARPESPPPPASAAPAEARIPALRELPDDLRRQIPALSVGGSTWSESAASRFVIINGQLFRENDALAPELTLRSIRQRSAILEFRGQRFELGF